MAFHFLLQGIFLTQRSNPHLLCLLHWGGFCIAEPLGKPQGGYYSATKSNELLMWSMQQHEWIWKTLRSKRNEIQKSEYCMILLIFKNRQNSPVVIEIKTPVSMQGGDWFSFLGPWKDFPVAQVIKESACDAEDQGSIPGLGRSSGEGNGNPVQYSCLENSMDKEAWQTTVCGVAKSWTRLSD